MREDWMSSAIEYRDVVEVDVTAFEEDSPSRWDVVVLHRLEEPKRPLILRVVGLPGESLSLADGDLLVDGTRTSTPASVGDIEYHGLKGQPLSITSGRELTVPPNHYYVLGDAPSAYDSRFFGAVHRNRMDGRIVGVVGRWDDRRYQKNRRYNFLVAAVDIVWAIARIFAIRGYD